MLQVNLEALNKINRRLPLPPLFTLENTHTHSHINTHTHTVTHFPVRGCCVHTSRNASGFAAKRLWALFPVHLPCSQKRTKTNRKNVLSKVKS